MVIKIQREQLGESGEVVGLAYISMTYIVV